MSLELMLRMAHMMNEDQLLYELERTIRAYREHKTEKLQNEASAYAMMLLSKWKIKEEDIEKFTKDAEQMKRLHKLFTGREN